MASRLKSQGSMRNFDTIDSNDDDMQETINKPDVLNAASESGWQKRILEGLDINADESVERETMPSDQYGDRRLPWNSRLRDPLPEEATIHMSWTSGENMNPRPLHGPRWRSGGIESVLADRG